MNITPVKIQAWGEEAASEFVEDGVLLNTTIAKIAKREELGQDAIQRVVEESNHLTREKLASHAGYDGSTTFPLANIDGVLGELLPRAKPTLAKLASAMPAPVKAVPASFFTEMSGGGTASDFPSLLKAAEAEAKWVVDRFKHFQKMAQVEVAASAQGVRDYMKHLVKVARDHVVMDNGSVQDMMRYACAARPEHKGLWKDAFEHVLTQLKKLGHPVDKKLIDETIEIPSGKVDVINGASSLLVELDTLKNKLDIHDRNTAHLQVFSRYGDAAMADLRKIQDPSIKDGNESARKWIAEATATHSKVASLMRRGYEETLDRLDKTAGVMGSLVRAGGKGLQFAGKAYSKIPSGTIPAAVLAGPVALEGGRAVGKALGTKWDPAAGLRSASGSGGTLQA